MDNGAHYFVHSKYKLRCGGCSRMCAHGCVRNACFQKKHDVCYTNDNGKHFFVRSNYKLNCGACSGICNVGCESDCFQKKEEVCYSPDGSNFFVKSSYRLKC